MKLWKKLLPVATVAATTACVVPMVTSCASVVFSTSDYNFTPDTKHSATEITDKAGCANILKEYVSSAKNFAQDYGYTIAKSMKSTEASFKTLAESGIIKDNYNVKFNYSTSNVSISEQKDFSVKISSEPVTYKGYTVSGEINAITSMFFEYVDKSKAEASGSEVLKGTTTVTQNVSYKMSVVLRGTGSYVSLYLYELPDQDWYYSESTTYSIDGTDLEGKAVNKSVKDTANESHSGGSAMGSGYAISYRSFSASGLYYFTDVTFNVA